MNQKLKILYNLKMMGVREGGHGGRRGGSWGADLNQELKRIEDFVQFKKRGGKGGGGGEGFRGRFEPIIENIVKRSIKMGGRGGRGVRGDGFEGKIEDIVQFKRRVVGGQGWGREGSGREGMDVFEPTTLSVLKRTEGIVQLRNKGEEGRGLDLTHNHFKL